MIYLSWSTKKLLLLAILVFYNGCMGMRPCCFFVISFPLVASSILRALIQFYLCSPVKSDDFEFGYFCYIINHNNFMFAGMNLTLLISQIAVSLSKLFTVLLLLMEGVLGSCSIVLELLSVQVHTIVWLCRSYLMSLTVTPLPRPHTHSGAFRTSFF